MSQPLYDVLENDVKILDENGVEINGFSVTYDSEDKKIIVNFSNPLTPSSNYTVLLTKDIKVTKQQTLLKEIRNSFSTWNIMESL